VSCRKRAGPLALWLNRQHHGWGFRETGHILILMDLMRTSPCLSTMSPLQAVTPSQGHSRCCQSQGRNSSCRISHLLYLLRCLSRHQDGCWSGSAPGGGSLRRTWVWACSRDGGGQEAAEPAWRSPDVRWIWLEILAWVLGASILVFFLD
jgi:hypothetical protein